MKKMNKYQEAIHDLKMAVEYPKSKYNDSRLIDLCFENIQELVEKATPKKPKIHKTPYNYIEFECPNCNKATCTNFLRPYCGECGQALDWSNCDE